jgi:hypothetical protein
VEELDFNSLEPELIELRDDYLSKIAEKAFVRDEFDYRRWQMDLALKQEFMDQGLSNRDYLKYNLDSASISKLTGEELEDLENISPDSYSDLYLPLMLKFFRAYLVNMSNLNFPSNGDWLNVTRSFSQYFYKTGIEKFLPFINDSWVDIIKTENQRFDCKDIYKTSMAECISYGNTVLGHSYNPISHYIEPFTPGIGQAGIFPISDNWRKSNLVFYYDVNYSELLERSDFDQDILSEIEPQEAGGDSSGVAGYGSSSIKDHYKNSEPFGKVRLYDFFLPSVFLKGKDSKEKFVAKNVYVTALIRPRLDSDTQLEHKEVYVLKATQNVSPVEHGLLFAAFSTNLPGVFYNQGPLQPFLPHQYTSNQFISEIARTAGMATDPPKNVIPLPGGVMDPMETPSVPFEAGAEYTNVKVESLINLTDASNSINVGISMLKYLESVVEEGVGISKGQMGSIHQGRKTATEIKESYSGSQLNIVEAAGRFDEQILRPSIICRIRATQQILEDQIKQALEEVQGDPQIQDEEQAYELALGGNELFNRLLNYSGIEASYENFYKKTQAERIEDMAIFQEVQMMGQQVQQMLAAADAPIQPPPPIPQREVPDPNNPERTIVVPPAAEIATMQQQWVQAQMQQKEQARTKAKQMEIDVKIKSLTFADTKEPPPPSKKLFYEMLIAPITDSDIVVTGSMTTISKELARENLLMLLNALQGFPQGAAMKVDYDGILQMLARANDVSLRDMLKDETQLLREEESQKKEQLRNQQLQDMAAQGKPGSQPPQWG